MDSLFTHGKERHQRADQQVEEVILVSVTL
jgi:hypothetical protein